MPKEFKEHNSAYYFSDLKGYRKTLNVHFQGKHLIYSHNQHYSVCIKLIK